MGSTALSSNFCALLFLFSQLSKQTLALNSIRPPLVSYSTDLLKGDSFFTKFQDFGRNLKHFPRAICSASKMSWELKSRKKKRKSPLMAAPFFLPIHLFLQIIRQTEGKVQKLLLWTQNIHPFCWKGAPFRTNSIPFCRKQTKLPGVIRLPWKGAWGLKSPEEKWKSRSRGWFRFYTNSSPFAHN